MADIIPTNDDGLLSWALHGKDKVTEDGAAAGLSPAEITAFTAAFTKIIAILQASTAANAAAVRANADKAVMKKTNLPALRKLIAHAKTNGTMTEGMIGEFKWVATSPSVDLATYKPTGRVVLGPNGPRIIWEKGPLHGIHIYVLRNGAWVWLDRDDVSPYDDLTPLAVANTPESRTYKIRGVVNDEEVGVDSDAMTILYGG